MIPQPHRLPAEDFAALAHGGGGTRVIRALVAARRSKTLLLIRFILDAAGDDPQTRRAYQVLRQVQRVAPDAVDRVLDDPSVGVWANRTVVELSRGGSAGPAQLARIALAAAVRGRVTTTVLLPSPPQKVISLPSLGIALRAASGELAVRCGPEGTNLGGGVRIPFGWWEDGPGWRATPALKVDSDGIRASFLLNGWAPGELAPDLRVCANPDTGLWHDRIAEGWDLLVCRHREVADELAAAVTMLTPLRRPPSGVHSATVVDAFGCVFLSLAPDAESLALTLAHELQHTKLNALMDLFELLEPVPGERFYAPWRDDPRPLAGLLHGTYAYAGVSAFWRRQCELETVEAAMLHTQIEFAHWRASTLEAAQTLLASGRLTEIGRKFVAGMANVSQRWCSEQVPKEALTAATRRSDEHRARWKAIHHA